jgi:hypothetical protein
MNPEARELCLLTMVGSQSKKLLYLAVGEMYRMLMSTIDVSEEECQTL